MANVFDGPPDARQSDDPNMPTSRFRPRYRALSEGEKLLHDQIKNEATLLEGLFAEIETRRMADGRAKQPREVALALTNLEVSIFWAIKALTA